MTDEERVAFITAKREQREGIQGEIQSASEAREVFVKAALFERIGEAGLGEAMRRAIREQAIAKGFTCDGEDC
jgi:hypothetical protein